MVIGNTIINGYWEAIPTCHERYQFFKSENPNGVQVVRISEYMSVINTLKENMFVMSTNLIP